MKVEKLIDDEITKANNLIEKINQLQVYDGVIDVILDSRMVSSYSLTRGKDRDNYSDAMVCDFDTSVDMFNNLEKELNKFGFSIQFDVSELEAYYSIEYGTDTKRNFSNIEDMLRTGERLLNLKSKIIKLSDNLEQYGYQAVFNVPNLTFAYQRAGQEPKKIKADSLEKLIDKVETLYKSISDLSEQGGIKHDDGKLRYDLIPAEAIESLAKILTYGAEKYEENNWQGLESKRIYSALMRHLEAWRLGNTNDEESGYLHLEHVLVNAMMLLEIERNKQG